MKDTLLPFLWQQGIFCFAILLKCDMISNVCLRNTKGGDIVNNLEINMENHEETAEKVSRNFIQNIIDKDLEEGTYQSLMAICISAMQNLFF